MNKIYRYIEKRNDEGLLIGIEEVKTATSLDEIVKINKEIKINNEQIEVQKSKDEAAKETAFYLAQKEKEKEEFINKYSISRFIIASCVPFMLGDFKDFDFIEKITKMNDKYEAAKLIKLRLEKADAVEVKNIFEKF